MGLLLGISGSRLLTFRRPASAMPATARHRPVLELLLLMPGEQHVFLAVAARVAH